MLLNSLGTDLSLWDCVGQMLQGQFRLLRMDSRGHGASDAPGGDYSLEALASDALVVMDAAGVDRAAVCGLSLGGMVAMMLALRVPHRVTALVCACTSAQMDVDIWPARIDTVCTQGLVAIADLTLQRFFSKAFIQNHPEITASVRTRFLAMSADGYLGCCAAIRDMNLIGRLEAITAPTLVISGTQDISTPFEGHGERIVGAITGARAVSLATGHLACLESPAAFAEAVLDFLVQVFDGSAAFAPLRFYSNPTSPCARCG